MRLSMHYSHLLRDEVLCVSGISIWLLVVGRIPLLKRSVAHEALLSTRSSDV